MRVEAFTTRRLSSLYEGYRPGDPLELCYEADRPDLEGLEPEDAAQAVFGELNHDDRLNPAFPSLSVGDVVSYRTRSGEAGALAIGVFGFRAVWPHPTATDRDRAVYRRKLEAWDERGR